MKKIFMKIKSIIPLLILGLTILLIFQLGYSIANGEVPTFFGRAISYVPTNSMEEEIMAGDIIVINTNYDTLESGDVISFYAKINGQRVSITHRITEISGDFFTTQGDNNDQIASWETDVHVDNVIGVYKGWRSPIFGAVYGALFAGNFNIMFLLIIVIFIVIIVIEGINIIKILQERKQEDEKVKMIEEAKQKILQDEDNQ